MSDFKPTTRYYQALDMILCAHEDVTYRSQTVGDSLEVLWHPTERYLVGIKILHAKRVYRALSAIPSDQSISLVLLVCSAILESRQVEPPPFGVLQDFLQQHRTGTELTPEERVRVEFTLAPTG
jgi:hypothetical protein